MPVLKKIPFVVSDAQSYSSRNNNSSLVNMYVHAEETGAKSNHILIGTPGVELMKDSQYKVHGVYEFKNKIYIATRSMLFVYNEEFRRLDEIGAINIDRRAFFADNGLEMVFVAGNGYSYNPATNTLKSMDQDGWYQADTVAYQDGYFIFNRTGTGQFFISKLYSTDLEILDWATGEAAPDDTVAVVSINQQLWIFGKKSTEVWYNSGDLLFPFTRIAGAASPIGCFNYASIAVILGSIFFVGHDGRVYNTAGYQSKPISTPSVEKAIKEAGKDGLSGFSYYSDGHWFYVLHIDADTTMVFDPAIAQWHRRSSSGAKWIVDGAVNIYNSGSVVAFGGTKVYNMALSLFTDDGTPIMREAVSVPINETVNRVRLLEVQLDCDVGLAKEGHFALQTSKDGGVNWSNYNNVSTGKLARTLHRVRWQRLGQFRDVSVKISTFDPVPVRILGLWGRVA